METEYDQSGQPKRLKNNGGFVYVSDARYDLFGRPTLIRHGNLLDDERTYYDAPGQNRHRRLRTLKTHVVGSSYLDLRYAENYTVRGQIGQVVDNIHASGPLSNRATYGYDALGRLTGLTGVGASGLETSYAYDSYGRITQKASRNIHYHDAARPHWPSEVRAGTTTTPVAHDLNGNRTRAKGGNPDYTYDAWDRLATIAVPGTGSVSFVHDYSGRRAAKVVNTVLGPGVTYYYSDLAELSGNQLFKSYYLGGLRVASQRKSCTGCELAALTPTEAVRLAAVSLKSPALVVLLRRDVELALAAALVLFGTGVLLAPWKRRRVVGITLRHGQVIVVAVFFLSGTFPWPILLRPAEAQCGNPPTPTPQPTPTATPVSVGEVRHYHTDHLGSTQVVTDINGLIVEQIRYQPYGEVRGRFDHLGNPIANPDPAYRYEFTGYETEFYSGIQYAGARFYDPVLGLFLTQDPAAQFASPYTYTGWDPVNLTDPNGEFAWLIPLIKFAIVGFAVGFAVSAIQAGINGAPAGAALKAGLIGGALGAATGAVLGPIGYGVEQLAKPIVSLAYNLALTGLGGYGAYQGITTGNYLVAAVAMVGVAFGVKGAFDATKQLLARASAGANEPGWLPPRGTPGSPEDAFWRTSDPLFPGDAVPPPGARGDVSGDPLIRELADSFSGIGGPVDDVSVIARPYEELGAMGSHAWGRSIQIRNDLFSNFALPTSGTTIGHEFGHAAAGGRWFGSMLVAKVRYGIAHMRYGYWNNPFEVRADLLGRQLAASFARAEPFVPSLYGR